MKYLPKVLVLFLISSCIPLRIAPTIKEDRLMVAKKFKRQLPRDYALVFEDPKDANEFYNFINTKYELDDDRVEWNVPFTIDGETFTFSFYEVEIPTKTINLVPIIIDAKLAENDYDPLLADAEFSRKGNWYLALTAFDASMKDALAPSHKHRDMVVRYLRDLRLEYLNTHNYVEALLKK